VGTDAALQQFDRAEDLTTHRAQHQARNRPPKPNNARFESWARCMENSEFSDIKSIEGWLLDEEIRYLYDEASEVEDGCIMEIGSYRGKSTVTLAYGADVPVYTVDPHENMGHFGPSDRVALFENLLKFGVAERVRPLEVKSSVAAKGWEEEISLLFIDGDHSYEACKNDVLNWAPNLADGGVIAFHDVGQSDDVKQVFEEALEGDFELRSRAGSIGSVQCI